LIDIAKITISKHNLEKQQSIAKKQQSTTLRRKAPLTQQHINKAQ